MKREDIKVLILRAPGTNCDLEAVRSFEDMGAKVDLIHTQRVFKDKNLDNYDLLLFPGGFSYGDYVRSGAIWAKECESRIGPELEAFVDSGKPIIGICNGFQQLVEMGYLPGWEGHSLYPEAALGNSTHGYQNRWIRMKYDGKGNCGMMGGLNEGHIIQCPVAHGEGRFILPPEQREELLNKLYDKQDLRRRKQRIRALTRGEILGQSTREAVEAVQAAQAAAAMVAVTVATSGS